MDRGQKTRPSGQNCSSLDKECMCSQFSPQLSLPSPESCYDGFRKLSTHPPFCHCWPYWPLSHSLSLSPFLQQEVAVQPSPGSMCGAQITVYAAVLNVSTGKRCSGREDEIWNSFLLLSNFARLPATDAVTFMCPGAIVSINTACVVNWSLLSIRANVSHPSLKRWLQGV